MSRCRVAGCGRVALVGQVAGDRGAGLGEDRDAAPGSGLPQPCAQFVPEGDERDDRRRDRSEQGGQRAGELSATVPVPTDSRSARACISSCSGPVEHKLGEEGVEIGEVPVQDAFGAVRLVGDGPAGQALGPSRSSTRSAASNS